MRLSLDADVFILLTSSDHLEALIEVGQLPVVITDAVWHELVEGSTARATAVDNAKRLLEAWAGTPTVITPESPASLDFVRLSAPDLPKYGAGERSVIAHALHNPDVSVVLQDRLAVFRGLEELLDGRVLTLHGALRELEKWGVPRAAIEDISRLCCRRYPQYRQPLWWTTR